MEFSEKSQKMDIQDAIQILDRDLILPPAKAKMMS